MKTLALNRQDTFRLLRECIAASDRIKIAVAWAKSNHPIEVLLRQHKKAIQSLIVGTSFGRTDAAVLKDWCQHPKFRVWRNFQGGVFHPKVFLLSGADWTLAIIGSSNLTHAGLSEKSVGNVEISMAYFEGKADASCRFLKRLLESRTATVFKLDEPSMKHAFFSELESQLSSFFNQAVPVTEEFIKGYEALQHAKRITADDFNHALLALDKKTDTVEGRSVPDSVWLSFEWLELKAQMVLKCATRHQQIPDEWAQRLEILRLAREGWRYYKHLNCMPKDFRLALAGIHKRYLPELGLLALDWYAFGHIVAVNLPIYAPLAAEEGSEKELDTLSRAFDQIPLAGPVTEGHFQLFLKHYQKLLAIDLDKSGMSAPTRLLALKRPDVFLPITHKTRKVLARVLGVHMREITLQSYWSSVITPIRQKALWNKDMGESVSTDEIGIWNGRMALLDTLFWD